MAYISENRVGAHADLRAVDRPSLDPLQLDAAFHAFSSQSCNFSSFAAMSVGALAYQASRNLLTTLPFFRVSAFASRVASPLLALSAEVSAVRGVQHSFSSEFSPGSQWSTDYLQFASLKIFGRFGMGFNPIFNHLAQALGMVVGHQIAFQLNLAESPQGSLLQQLTHAEIMNFQMQAGLGLFNRVLGHSQGFLQRKIHFESAARSMMQNSYAEALSSTPFFNSEDSGFFRSRKGPSQARLSPGYFLDGKSKPSLTDPAELSFVYHELMERAGDRRALRTYIERHLNPESYVLRQLSSNLKPMTLAYEVHAVIGALRYLGLREGCAESLRSGFFEVLAIEENPQALARHEAWEVGNPLMLEVVDWLYREGITHPDPWTRHYALRILHEWSLEHPEIERAEHGSLRAAMVQVAHVALGDVAWTNMMLGWHLLHRLEPANAMDDSHLSRVPMAHVVHPKNLQFGLERYVDASAAEGAFLKYQRSLNGIPKVIGTQAVQGDFSLYGIHPSHSLADFNPNAHRRFEAVRQKYGILLEMRAQGRLTRENILRDFLFHEDPEEGPIILHWQRRHAWLKGGHHRMTALHLAAEHGLIPRKWLHGLPLLSFDYSRHMPERIYYQYFSRGSEPLNWEELVPEGYLR